jgi:uncharacterized protein (DUF1697 family)
LLRGVNVGGRNALPMAELRALVESLGFTEVTTLIQSGNVAFSARKRPAPERLATAIQERFGFAAPVVLRSREELARALAANPFTAADPATLHLGFLGAAPAPQAVAALEADRHLPERFHIAATELYLELPSGMARAKLPVYLERRLGVTLTLRNWRTSERLLALASG